MPCAKKNQAYAGVCAFLGTVDQGFNAKTELETLEHGSPNGELNSEDEILSALKRLLTIPYLA